MSIELGLIFGAIACIIGVAGFYGGRITAAKSDSAETATMVSDIEYLKKAVDEIKQMLKEDRDTNRAEMKQMQKDVDDSIRRIHDRLDEHIRSAHK